jgi:hypothetical protein
MRRRSALLAAIAALLLSAAPAHAGGGSYAFAGGTASQREQVRRALDASSFPWSIVPGRVVIHIVPGHDAEALPGHIWVDANLLDGTTFGWGVVQHEYAHQVDFLLFDDATRERLNAVLGGDTWYQSGAHGAAGVERFASTLAWSYWTTSQNAMEPTSPSDEAAALPTAAFRALMASVLPQRSLAVLRRR